MRAAKLAGFSHVELLQEPVAAATAYGLNTKEKDAYWVVFDFGGGTFDAALVKSEEGILSVKDTDGDAWLGGKNLDEGGFLNADDYWDECGSWYEEKPEITKEEFSKFSFDSGFR
jgi:hypothetical protein